MMATKAAGGKPLAAGGGMKIRAADEKAKMAADIKSTLDSSSPPKLRLPADLPPRELGAMELGEQIPMDHLPPTSSADDSQWFSALHSFQSDLCVILEPNSPHAWIAVERKDNPRNQKPILLFRLPLANRPSGQNPF